MCRSPSTNQLTLDVVLLFSSTAQQNKETNKHLKQEPSSRVTECLCNHKATIGVYDY